MTHSLPEPLKETACRIFGDDGRAWIERFPSILDRCVRKWDLTELEPVAEHSINYVAYAKTGAGDDVVLKVGVPHREFHTEVEALGIYAGRGIVRCLDFDGDLSAMLLERIKPGCMLTSLAGDAQQTQVAARIMATLPVPCPEAHDLPTFAEWVNRAFARVRRDHGPDAGPLGASLVEKAERAMAAIEESKDADVLLHGDLHHMNILFDEERGWLAIDPKGAIGDRCLETGRFIQNQLPETLPDEELSRTIEERVEIIASSLAVARERIRLCALIDSVLSLSWGLEEEAPGPWWSSGLRTARTISALVEI